MDEELPESEWTIEDWKANRDALVAENMRLQACFDTVLRATINAVIADMADDIEPAHTVREWLVAYTDHEWYKANEPKEKHA